MIDTIRYLLFAGAVVLIVAVGYLLGMTFGDGE